jgi:hypothetical protein
VALKCKYCRDPLKGKDPRRFCCHKPECKKKRQREWRLRKHGIPLTEIPRICIHCGETYFLLDHRSNRRQYCYDPECETKNKQWAYVKAKELTIEWRKKPKNENGGGLPCQICKRPLPKDGSRHFNHDRCVERIVGRTDGDYKYNQDIGILEV